MPTCKFGICATYYCVKLSNKSRLSCLVCCSMSRVHWNLHMKLFILSANMKIQVEFCAVKSNFPAANPVSLEKNVPALRSDFLSVFGFSTDVDELASSVVCGDLCINHTLEVL